MLQNVYPDAITSLPQVDTPFEGLRGWLSQGPDHQIVFFDIDPIGVVAPHSHGEQWGVVVSGRMELTIGGVARVYGPGESYHIPAKVVHSAKFLSRVQVIDFFADPDRYRAK